MELLDEFGIPIIEDFKTSAERFRKQGASEDDLIDYFVLFKQMKPKIKDNVQKDIDKWKTWDEFKAFVDDLKTVKTKGQEKKEKKMAGAKLVTEDKFWRVYHITTHEAAMLYGSGTKWCITNPDGEYWEKYSADSDFYFYISKRLPPSSPFHKIALQVEDGSFTYWDATDKSHGHSERDLYHREKLGSIPFKLPDVPEDVLNATKSKREDEEPMHTIFLNPDSEVTQKMRDEILKIEPEAFVQVGPSGEADHINLHTNDESVVKKAIEILGSDLVAEVSPELTT